MKRITKRFRRATFLLILGAASLAHGQDSKDVHFQKLLDKLDHAPVSFEQMGPSAARGSAMSQVATETTGVIEKATPTLKAMGESHLLGLASKLPVVGTPAAIAKEAMLSITEIAAGMRLLVDADKAWVEPLRQAVTACNELRHSHDRKDLEHARLSLHNAIPSLEKCSDLCKSYAANAVSAAKLADRLKQLFSDPKAANQATPDLGANFRKTAGTLSLMSLEFAVLIQYTKGCATEADLASGQVENDSPGVTESKNPQPLQNGLPPQLAAAKPKGHGPFHQAPEGSQAAAQRNEDSRLPETVPQPHPSQPVLPYILLSIGLCAVAVAGTFLALSYRRAPVTAVRPQAQLEISGRTITLSQLTTIGRESGSDVQIDDPLASGTHACIMAAGSGFRIFDLDSTKGTLLNRSRITEAELRSGDVISIGRTEMIFRPGGDRA